MNNLGCGASIVRAFRGESSRGFERSRFSCGRSGPAPFAIAGERAVSPRARSSGRAAYRSTPPPYGPARVSGRPVLPRSPPPRLGRRLASLVAKRIFNPSPPPLLVSCDRRHFSFQPWRQETRAKRRAKAPVKIGRTVAQWQRWWGEAGLRILLATSETSRLPSNWRGGGGSREEGADRHARSRAGRKRTSCTLTTAAASTWRDAPSSRDPRTGRGESPRHLYAPRDVICFCSRRAESSRAWLPKT